ncbi:MAG: acylphosphatase [Chloroflexi bacterium]|nr:acylphosphatase [Chloroflexota bacterium]
MTETSNVDSACLHLWVTGRVQGVGFRAFVARQAQLLGLSGWVRNLGDNQVEILASGARPALEEFQQIVGRGPSSAHVQGLRSESLPLPTKLAGFEIRHSI